MSGGLKSLAFVTLLLLGAAYGDLLNANDAQSCMELCASCAGTATFENGRCECTIPEGNMVAAECVKRLKPDTTNLDLIASSPGLATSERSPRCSLLGSRRRLASADADRVANYFMKGGPLVGSSLLGKSNTDCSPTSNYGLTGASNNPKSSLPVEPVKEAKVASQPEHRSPVVGASAPSNCGTGEYEPVVGTQWLPNYGMGPRMLGAQQPTQGAYYYPHALLGAVPHWLLATPTAPLRATHVPAVHHNPGLLTSPLLSSLASGTHGVLQRLDNMIAPYATEHNRGNVVGKAHVAENPCGHSHEPSHLNSRLVGVPRLAPQVAAHEPNPRILQQVLAHQNNLLEALSNHLASYSPHVAAPALQYAPVPYMLGAAAPMGQCYCPNGGTTPLVEAANPHDNESTNTEKSSKSSPEHAEAVKATNKDSSDESNEEKNEPQKDEKKSDDDKIVEATEPAAKKESAEVNKEDKNKSELDSHSSARKKRGNLKYSSKKSVSLAS